MRLRRADEVAEPASNQVADIEKTKRAVSHAYADRPRILAAELSADLDALARGIRLAGAVERARQRRAVGAHHVDVDAAERQPVAWLRHEVLGVPARLFVGGE